MKHQPGQFIQHRWVPKSLVSICLPCHQVAVKGTSLPILHQNNVFMIWIFSRLQCGHGFNLHHLLAHSLLHILIHCPSLQEVYPTQSTLCNACKTNVTGTGIHAPFPRRHHCSSLTQGNPAGNSKHFRENDIWSFFVEEACKNYCIFCK